MKIKKKQFELFKKECERWIKKLDLSGYRFYYHLGGNRPDTFCTITIDQVGRVASLFLAEDFYDKDDKPVTTKIKEAAKHEMLHALLGGMSSSINRRFLNESDAEGVEEELVRKLEQLIK